MTNPYEISSQTQSIEVEKLLLWDRNPRLRLENLPYTKLGIKLRDEEVQGKLRKLIKDNPKYKLNRLVDSIDKEGFKPDNPLYVDSLKGTDKFFVIEGNRRLAAIKTLHQSRLKKEIKTLPCYLVNFKKKSGVDYESALNLCVAEQHYIKGKEEHGGIERALVYYEVYMAFLLKIGAAVEPVFRLRDDILKETKAHFKDAKVDNELKTELSIAVIFKQLQEFDFASKGEVIRERLYWVNQNAEVFLRHYGFKKDTTLQINRSEIELFYDLFVKKECAVSSPNKKDQYIQLLKHKGWQERYHHSLRKNPKDLEKLYVKIVRGLSQTPGDPTQKKRGLKEGLTKAINVLKSVLVENYGNTPQEDKLIRELASFSKKFEKLLSHNLGLGRSTEEDDPDDRIETKGPASPGDILGSDHNPPEDVVVKGTEEK